VSDLSLSLSQPLSLSSYFLSPVQLRRGSGRAVLVGTWYLSRLNQNSQAGVLSTGSEGYFNIEMLFSGCIGDEKR